MPKGKKRTAKKAPDDLPSLPVFNPFAQKAPAAPSQTRRDEGASSLISQDDDEPFKPCQYEESPIGGFRIKSQYDQPNVDNGAYLPKGALSILICGKAGSGKSRLLLTLVPQLRVSSVVLFSKIEGSPIYSDLRDYCHEKEIDFHIAHSLDEAPGVMESCVESKKPDTWGLCIFDDFNDYDTSRGNPYMKFINTCVGMLRNYQFHFISITQSYTNFSTLARTNAGVRFCFAINDINAIRRLKEDWVQMTDHGGNDFDDLYRIVRQTKHSFLMFGDDSRIFIYLANESSKGWQLVEFNTVGQKLESDTELNRLCKMLQDEPRNAIQKSARMRAKKELASYIEYLCRAHDVDEQEIQNYIYEHYKI
jgi:energy-coupling factor transporter ATP-binding protein EcfA2